MKSNSKGVRIGWTKLKIILFGICGGIIADVIFSIVSLPISLTARIIQGVVWGSIISCGIVSGIVFSTKFTKNRSTKEKALIIIICATVGGAIGHLICAIIISISVVSLGVPIKNTLSGITSITSNGIIFSLGISLGLTFARIISRNKPYILRILIMAIGGLIGNIAVEFSSFFVYGTLKPLRLIFGLIVGLFIALAEKEEIIIGK